MDDLLKIKADTYDVLIEIEDLRKKIEILEKKKTELRIKMEAVTKTKVVEEKTDELRIKEQRIIEKRLKKISPDQKAVNI